MPAVQPKAKMMPACNMSTTSRMSGVSVTYQDNIRERKEEERPFKVLPISRLVLRLVLPQPQLLRPRALLIARVYFANALRGSSMCRSKTLLAIFLVGGLSQVVDNYPMLGIRKLITFVEKEARKHGLFETAEKEKKYAGFDDGCDPVRPAPAKSVCDGSASDKSKTSNRSVCDSMNKAI
jgi:hypothetical protein